MVSVRTPLSTQVPIVDPKTGNPTPFFQRLMQVLLEEKAITDTNADDALAGLAAKADKTITISAGTGLLGGGDLSANRVLSLDTSAEAERIRDVIGAALVNGTGISITVNDPGDTITIAATGSASGYPWWWNPPNPASFTLLSYDATAPTLTSDTDVGTVFSFNANGVAGDEGKVAVVAAPVGWTQIDYTAKCLMSNTNFTTSGIVLRNSANNRFLTWGDIRTGNNSIATRFTMVPGAGAASSTFSANVTSVTHVEATPIHHRITLSGTTLTFWFSYDGKNYIPMATTEAFASWLAATPTHIGFGLFMNAALNHHPKLAVQKWSIT